MSRDSKLTGRKTRTALLAAAITLIAFNAASCDMLDLAPDADELEPYPDHVETVCASEPTEQPRMIAPLVETEVFPAEEEQPEPETINEIVYAPIWADIPLAAELQHYIADVCEERHISTAIVLAVIRKESSYIVDAVGDRGRAQGLMQVQSRWHAARMEEYGCTDMLDPFENVTIGIDFLDEMIDKGYGIEWALTAYNGGEVRAHKFRDAGEISSYAASVLEIAAEINA